ncbi:MAG: hypothetical protein R3253_16890, partial [Longimicrobiales bacterium]|nr:hypothetical protein [Longimicrobiales bacterium]
MSTTGGSRRGAVLVVVVLLSLALLGLAHGLLVSAELAYTTSAAHREVVELDALAQGRMQEEVAGGWRAWMDSVGVGDSRRTPLTGVGDASVQGRWRRLTSEVWLVKTWASRGRRPPVTLRRPVWLLDPARRLASLPGVVSVGPASPVNVLGTVTPDSAPALGVVAAPSLGVLDLRRLVERGDRLGSSATPGPLEAGAGCDVTDVWNWGDPVRPYRPCGGHRPLLSRVGDLTVAGGEGQGVLVVDGDVVMAGTRFHGVVVASGRVELRNASVVEGRVVALGGIEVDAASRVE